MKHCAMCGVEMPLASERRIYCSKRCRSRSHRTAGFGPASLPYDDDIREAVAAKLPATVVAAKYGVVDTTIRNRACVLGLRFEGRAPTPAWHSGAPALHARGMTDRAIAEHYGVTPSAVATWRASKGLPVNPSYRAPEWHAEALALQAKGYGLQLICDATGHTTHAVRAVLAKHGLTRNDPKRATPAPKPAPIESDDEPEEIESEPEEQPEDPDESNDWPASVAAPTLPEESRVPCVLIRGGEIVNEVVQGGTIIGRYDDFIEALQWLRLESPPCIVARARDYVALAFTQTKPKKAHKPINIFRE